MCKENDYVTRSDLKPFHRAASRPMHGDVVPTTLKRKLTLFSLSVEIHGVLSLCVLIFCISSGSRCWNLHSAGVPSWIMLFCFFEFVLLL